jgi:hypothetical protein
LDHRPILDQVVVDEEVAGGATQSGVAFLKLPLSARAVDDEAGSGYRTRLDLRVTEATTGKRHWFQADWTTVRSWTR